MLILCLSMAAAAQVSAPPPRTQPAGLAAPQAAAPDLTPLLPQVQQAAESLNLDVTRLRIEKWKADSNEKQRAQQRADSISRNLSGALPGMIEQVRVNPRSLAAAIKLYRNLNALYDVSSGLVESAGAFGPKGDYQALAADNDHVDDLRRILGERLENLAAFTDAEVVRLRTEVVQAKAAAQPPKKVIVDEEPKKPARKKPAAKKKKPATEQSGASNPK